MNDLYDVILHLIERLLPDNTEKHTLVERVKELQSEHEKPVVREVKRDGSNKQ